MFNQESFGFLRVATAVPELRVANPKFNSAEIVRVMQMAQAQQVRALFLPELSITGYTCEDLFWQPTLQQAALDGLASILEASKSFNGVLNPSLPIKVGDFLFNAPFLVHQGKILGGVPKAYLAERGEFRDNRWFNASEVPHPKVIKLLGQQVPFGHDLLFTAEDIEEFILYLETCQAGWVTCPWNRFAILAGAKYVANDSASTALVGKPGYRHDLVRATSAQYSIASYAAAGVWESSGDNVYDGQQMIYENGHRMGEGKRFQRQTSMLVVDVDLQRVAQERLKDKTFADNARAMKDVITFRRVPFILGKTAAPAKLERFVDPHPFTPKDPAKLEERCAEIHEIQVNGLMTRLQFISRQGGGKTVKASIGISRGKDSMLAAEITREAYSRLGWSPDNVHGFALPGFGTPAESTAGALEYMAAAGFTPHVVDIRPICFAQWLEEGFKPFGIDLHAIVAQVRAKLLAKMTTGTATEADLDVNGPALAIFCQQLAELPADAQNLKFENDQARVRKEILQSNGFDIGTGNLLEMAQAWCTFLADHASNYHVNCGIPKSTVIAQLKWLAGKTSVGLIKTHLQASVGEVVSAHLLPVGTDGKSRQSTEESIGPTELGEFNLWNLVRWTMTPEKILYLARQAAFDRKYSDDELAYWLASFIKRFFISFKRNCSPDGPQVGPVSMSPRCAFRMPSDANVAIWLDWVNRWECASPEAAARLNKILATAEGSFTTGATVRHTVAAV